MAKEEEMIGINCKAFKLNIPAILIFFKDYLRPPPLKEKFPCPFLELTIYGSKSLYLATVKLCTSCSQTADRKALSLKLEMKFLSYWGIKKVFF
jgi:hypothetical protein